MSKPKSFIAYVITNTVNGKRYIGVTTRSLPRRWAQHAYVSRSLKASALGLAIAKHGALAFTMEAIASAANLDDLLCLERILIAQERTKSPHGYNLTGGGEGVFDPPETVRRRIGESQRGKTVSAVSRALMSAARKGKPGIPLSPEMLVKLALSQGTAAARANKSAGMKASAKAQANLLRLQEAAKNTPRTEASRAKMSASQKARFARCPQQSPTPELLARLVEAANRPEVLAAKSVASRRRWSLYSDMQTALPL